MNPLIKIGAGIVLTLLAIWFFTRGSNNETIINELPVRSDSTSVLTIIAFGDSLTAGYGLPTAESYPAQLEAVLVSKGYDVTVINAGVSGETTRGNLERAAFIRGQNPDIVLLGIGGNDALRLLPTTEARANIAKTIEILQAGDNPPIVLLLQMQAPLNVGLGYKKDFDAMYESLAAEYELVMVPFLTAEVFLDKNNKISDGIHLNKTGYKLVVDEYIVPTLETILNQVTGQP